MGIATFGLTAPYVPRLGTVRLSNTQIGSLAAVIAEEGGTAEDWTFETGVIGIVLRTADPTQRIHIAYDEDELDNASFSDTVLSGRSSAQGEIGFLGIGTPARFDGKKYNVYFRATTAAGAPEVATIFIELYFNIG